MKEFDAIIIGFGKGGKTLATELAQHDWKVAMIERSDKMYGGTCINIGWIPTHPPSRTCHAEKRALFRRTESGLPEGYRVQK